MSDYCLRFNAAAMEVHDLTEENGRLQKRIAELEAVIRDVVIPYIDPVDTDILDPVVKVLEGDADERA